MKLTARLLAARADNIPPGWLTCEQMARREGYASTRSFVPVRDAALRAGFIETRDFRAPWGRMVRLRPYYRYTKPGKKS